MLSRIMNNHTRVLSLPELHYFEKYPSHIKGDEKQLVLAAMYLLRIINKGYYNTSDLHQYEDEAKSLIKVAKVETYGELYGAVLLHIAVQRKVDYLCEQTPQNIFYTDDIKSIFPDAKFIHIIRDPRDVLLSQKRKWKRFSQGAKFIPIHETIRAYFNYHPYTISKIWNSVVSKALSEKIYTLRFEDILKHPRESVMGLCEEVGLSYEKDLELVHITGSSSNRDSEKKGINTSRAGAWQAGGLNTAELFICQKTTTSCAQPFNYNFKKVFPNPILLILYVVYFPFQLLIAVLLNLRRQRNIWSAIKRRLQL